MEKYVNNDYLIRMNKGNGDVFIDLSDAIGQMKIIDGQVDELIKHSHGNFTITPVGYISDNEFILTGFSLNFH